MIWGICPHFMLIACKAEWAHKIILDISQNITNIASNNSLFTRTCYISDIGWWWTCWAWRPCSPSFDIPKTTWLCEKVTLKNIHKNKRLISLVFNLETETLLWIKGVPNLLIWFHHTVECVKTLHLLQHTILKLVTTTDIFWTET